ARALLRGRLARHGLTVSGALLPPLLAGQAAAVPAGLRAATVTAGAEFAAGTVAGVSARGAALGEAGVQGLVGGPRELAGAPRLPTAAPRRGPSPWGSSG